MSRGTNQLHATLLENRVGILVRQTGEYHERVALVDLAVTFASLAGVNHPSAAVGRELIESIKPGPVGKP
jgi:arylsulfatase A-like enzyme